ncbi:unnamed protein product [Triticum turgidum subsp. durum]|uniref:Uncharacterized protein n=1 Tax=Triticum turgidum subsp. durum TaxID=4567 RepID=A0A9R0RR95_TRITD|nr:unnamed protein product [Triticum turgidum subsp. durum]
MHTTCGEYVCQLTVFLPVSASYAYDLFDDMTDEKSDSLICRHYPEDKNGPFSSSCGVLIYLRLQELAFGEEERTRNKKIQATIEEMIRKQSEALGKKRPTAKATANVFARKYRRNVRTRGRGRTVARDIAPTGSDDEDREEENANVESKELPSPDNHSPDSRQKRGRKRPARTPSPARTIGSSDHGSEENDEVVSLKEGFTTSPLRGEMLAWGKNGTRSQTRYNNVGGTNGRLGKGGRFAKLVDHLRATDENKEFNLYLVLLPLDGQTMPNLEKPYLSCRPRVSIRHLLQFIALQLSWQVEELEMYIRVDLHNRSVAVKDSGSAETKLSLFDGLERLREDELLLDLHPSFASGNGDLFVDHSWFYGAYQVFIGIPASPCAPGCIPSCIPPSSSAPCSISPHKQPAVVVVDSIIGNEMLKFGNNNKRNQLIIDAKDKVVQKL